MTEEKQLILNKIDTLLNKRTAELLEELPSVHEISDGIVIRFFTEWDNCAEDNEIKFKKVENLDDPDEVVVFFYIPKDSYFTLKQRFYIGCMTCLNGVIEITAKGETSILESYSKICVDSDDVQGKAYENTYLIVTSNKSEWSKDTQEHVVQYQ
jgi:hypothetical protein